ncbi:MAG: diguanylate cyclase [Chitinivibrionales bacterium]|nr:diguanylate cyclase [Chitinivibrionales bacterium]
MNRDPHWMEQTMGFEGDDQEPQVEETLPYLVMYTERNMGKRLDLSEAKVTIGRAPDADIVIDDKRVSKIHCLLQYQKGAILVEDNNSTNGTFLNGQRIDKASVTSSALLQIGGTVMKIEFKNKAEVDYEDELLRKATTDALTGIANRHYFMNRAREELAFARRANVLLGMVMLDIDHFKKVNDTYGHQAGDYVLSQFASLVDKRIRGEDLFGRYGGEEFCILMRGSMEPPGAKTFCERIRKTVEEFDFNFNGTSIPVTVSIGLALRKGADIQTIDEFIQAADKGLYKAKQDGRNRVEVV